MQILKKASAFLLRLLVVDSILLACTWIINLAISLKSLLAPYALSMKTTDVVDLNKVNTRMLEIEETIYVVHKNHTKHIDGDINAIRKEMADMAKDLYEEETEVATSKSTNLVNMCFKEGALQ